VETYALKHAIDEFDRQKADANIKVNFSPKEKATFALQILLIEKIDELNNKLDERGK
jgi:hypothetical protein